MGEQDSGGAAKRGPSGAALVAGGIFLSRIAGLVRSRVIAHVLGRGDAADAFFAAMRIPNMLQNLLGEGVLSAAFIPQYAKLLAAGDEKAATRLAGIVATFLSLVTAVGVLLGVLFAPALVDVIAPGFAGDKRAATIAYVRILFPGTGLLVLSAWCLGVLNSHRRLFLPYAAPVVWNAAIIAALLLPLGAAGPYDFAALAAWGAVVGSALQLAVQLPAVLKLVRGVRPSLETSSPSVRQVFKSFVPVVVSRGVVQISAFVEEMLASLLPTGAVASIGYASTLSMLPVSLFGMAVSAAALPEMARVAGDFSALSLRVSQGARRIAFFVLPSAAAFLFIGDALAALVFQGAEFTAGDATVVGVVLAGSAPGLVASTQSRLLSSALYALDDTVTPLRAALARVVLGTGLGALFALYCPALLHIDARFAVAGLTLGSSVGAIVELLLLRRAISRRFAVPQAPASLWLKLMLCALSAGGAAYGAKVALGPGSPLVVGVAVVAVFGVVYFALGAALGVEEARAIARSILRRLRLTRP